MVLVEDMVSRKHAKITTTGSQIVIQDLGSTNGSRVDGAVLPRLKVEYQLARAVFLRLVGEYRLCLDRVPKLCDTDRAGDVPPDRP